MSPRFPIMTEKAHPAEFILSEAFANRSRDNVMLLDPITVQVGEVLQLTLAATTDTPAQYAKATAGANVAAIAIYGGSSTSGENLRISVIARDAEVNERLINWGSLNPTEQAAGRVALRNKGIIPRLGQM